MDNDQVKKLIDLSRQNDTQAFALLVAEYQSMIFRLAFRLLCDEDEAKDMVQETFIRIWLSLDKYDPSFGFSTWLYRVAANICYDRLRQVKRMPEGNKSPADISGLIILSDNNVEAAFANKELKELILRLTGGLSPKQKTVFILRDIEEKEISEVAAITGLSPGKIKSNLYLARKYIRERLEET